MLTRAIILFLALAGTAHAGDKVAFFGLTFIDDSPQTAMFGEDPAEAARTAMLDDMIATRFTEEGYELVDLSPVAVERDRIVNPARCYGCDLRMATKLGADYALVGEIHKISSLILSLNLQLRDAETGELVKARAVDIRSNTDQSWQRGMSYILRTAFFREEEE